MPSPAARAALLSAVQPYLLLARFSGDLGAPLPATLPCDVGSLTLADTNAVLSQSGGVLVVNGAASSNNDGFAGATLTRKAGRALLLSYPSRTTMDGSARCGWTSQALGAGAALEGIRWQSASEIRANNGVSGIDLGFTGLSGEVQVAIVQRSAGSLLLARQGAAGAWTVLWVFITTATTDMPKHTTSTVAASYSIDNFRVIDLGGQWSDDYGIATQRLAGARVAGDSFTHTADCLIEWTTGAAPTGGNDDVRFRFTDANNCWVVRTATTTGDLSLLERNASVQTSRGSSAGNGVNTRIVVVAEGTTIKVYSGNTLRITYSSATLNQTVGAGQVSDNGTGSSVSDLVAWPRLVSLPAAA